MKIAIGDRITSIAIRNAQEHDALENLFRCDFRRRGHFCVCVPCGSSRAMVCSAPSVPVAIRFSPPRGIGIEQTSLIEEGVATSQHFMLVTSPSVRTHKAVDPFAIHGLLPNEFNLAVPFTSQAPTGEWALPYQEACEEASAIMVDAFYRGETGRIPPDVATKAITNLVAFEKKILGFYEDTSALDTAKFIKAYFGYPTVVIQPLTSESELKRAIANGYPVIRPLATSAQSVFPRRRAALSYARCERVHERPDHHERSWNEARGRFHLHLRSVETRGPRLERRRRHARRTCDACRDPESVVI